MERELRVKAEVNLSDIRHNYAAIRRHYGDEVKVLSVLKADAYGHGVSGVAKICDELTDYFAVATVEEAERIREAGGKKAVVYDASKTDVSFLISEVWRCAKIVIFCPTYNNGIYPPVKEFIEDMAVLGAANRTVALAENGSWAPASGKLMRAKFEEFKNITVLPDTFSFRSALHAADEERLDAFAKAVANA